MPSKEIMPPSATSHSFIHHVNPLQHQSSFVNDSETNEQQQLQQLSQNEEPLQPQQQQLQQPIKKEFISVEELVHEIKENLRLKARPPSHQFGGRSRPSPYHIPCRSWNDQQQLQSQSQLQQQQQQQLQPLYINNSDNNISICTECNNLSNSNLSSDYNSIECQTCKSRQQNSNTLQQSQQQQYQYYNRYEHHKQKKEQDIDDPYELLQKLLKSKNLVKEAVRRLQLNTISTKQRSYFYESDEESRSPMFRVCQLEL